MKILEKVRVCIKNIYKRVTIKSTILYGKLVQKIKS